MQTFVPSTSLIECAKILDNKRLGKQRVETLQILNALYGGSKGWVNHPATRMWRDYIPVLVLYGIVICDEWISRGYKDTCRDKILKYHDVYDDKMTIVSPKWWGSNIHSSHRSALLHKNFKFYSRYSWDEKPKLDYVWPV